MAHYATLNVEISKKRDQFSEGDQRYSTFAEIGSLVYWGYTILNTRWLVVGDKIEHKNYKFIFGYDYEDKELSELFTKYGVLSYITMLNFITEYFFRTILSHLNNNSKNNGFYTIVEEVLDLITVKAKKRKLAILNVPARMRNSLHSRKHTKETVTTTIDGFTYKFVQNKRVKNSANWVFAYVVTKKIVEILEEIMNSSEVKTIQKL